jgi:hypothetical protein
MGFLFLLCYNGAYGLASRCNFHITPTVVLINVHIVEVHLEMHKKKSWSPYLGGFLFLLCCTGAYGLASRYNIQFTATDVFRHTLFKCIGDAQEESSSSYLGGFMFYCVAVVHYGLASIHSVATSIYVLRSSLLTSCRMFLLDRWEE